MSGNAAPERKAAKAVKPLPKAALQTNSVKEAKPVPERKPRFGPGSEDRSAGASVKEPLPKGGQALVIGKNGRVQSAPKAEKPAAPQAKASRPASRKGGQPGLAKPVQRVNRARGRNGER